MIESSISELQKQLDTFAKTLEGVSSTAEGRFIPARRLLASVKKMRSAIQDSKQTHDCPYCNAKGCKACKGIGRVPKIYYDTAPMELKE